VNFNNLFEKARRIDNLYQNELIREFGKKAQDYRYDVRYNKSTPALAAYADASRAANDEVLSFVRATPDLI